MTEPVPPSVTAISRLRLIENAEDIIGALTPYHWVGNWITPAYGGAAILDTRYSELGIGQLITEEAQNGNHVRQMGQFNGRDSIELVIRVTKENDYRTFFGNTDITSSRGILRPVHQRKGSDVWQDDLHEGPLYKGTLVNMNRSWPNSQHTNIKLQPAFVDGKLALKDKMQEALVELYLTAGFKDCKDRMLIDSSLYPLENT